MLLLPIDTKAEGVEGNHLAAAAMKEPSEDLSTAPVDPHISAA
jgi:hypothetical protein